MGHSLARPTDTSVHGRERGPCPRRPTGLDEQDLGDVRPPDRPSYVLARRPSDPVFPPEGHQ
ncbi:hypothetical protein BJF86_09380 [Serinicoccus sp. CNJ-927]|nr:hypothetical protein BJF86_09380 [Serinicoccus sp. CNJ-927]